MVLLVTSLWVFKNIIDFILMLLYYDYKQHKHYELGFKNNYG